MARLLECEAKRPFVEAGLSVPAGGIRLTDSPETAEAAGRTGKARGPAALDIDPIDGIRPDHAHDPSGRAPGSAPGAGP